MPNNQLPQNSAASAKKVTVKGHTTKALDRKPKGSATPVTKVATKQAKLSEAKAISAKTKALAPAKKVPAKTAPLKPPVDAPKSEKRKDKLVRDSFTMPAEDWALIQQLKDRAIDFKRPTKKSELLRAGLQALAALSDARLKLSLEKLSPLKVGRPKGAKNK
jgi:hypothetical protein